MQGRLDAGWPLGVVSWHRVGSRDERVGGRILVDEREEVGADGVGLADGAGKLVRQGGKRRLALVEARHHGAQRSPERTRVGGSPAPARHRLPGGERLGKLAAAPVDHGVLHVVLVPLLLKRPKGDVALWDA